MLGYAIRRLLSLIPVFFVVSVLVFAVIHMAPGDPLDHLVRTGSGPEQRAVIAARYGLDKPLPQQYLVWMGNLLQGDLGDSLMSRRPVATLIGQVLPHSLQLGALALCFSAVVGATLGLIAALNKDRFLDNLVMGGALVGSTIPGFWLGLLLMLVFSVQLGWFPVSGAKSWSSLVLPVLTIGFGGVALVARVTRVSMIEAAGRDFVTLLHAKGLSPLRIQLRHILRHAMIPVVTILSLRIGWILGGAVIVEVVFARPGLGSLLIKALGQHDYPVIQACLLMLAMAVMLGTLLGDLVQAAMDPRVRAALA
jgi:peptide/nickel transport system permease protein/oligopeptide transport system permease protein